MKAFGGGTGQAGPSQNTGNVCMLKSSHFSLTLLDSSGDLAGAVSPIAVAIELLQSRAVSALQRGVCITPASSH